MEHTSHYGSKKVDIFHRYVIIALEDKSMDEKTLYNKVTAAIARGNNVEIRKGKDGDLQVFEIKKKII